MKVYTTILVVLIFVFSAVLAMPQEVLPTPQDDNPEVKHVCGPHELYYKTCGPLQAGCVRTCVNRFQNIACGDACTPGCYCKSGYIRLDDGGPCIRECHCPN